MLDCFNIQYTLPECGGVEITSPNFPNNYPNSDQCQWFLHSPTDKELNVYIQSFDTELDFDILRLGNGVSVLDTSTLIAELSGSVGAGTNYTTSTSSMWMTFVTDNDKPKQGFRLIVQDICIPGM